MKKIIVRIAEGIGNQLFMYANAYSLAKKTNSKLYIDNSSGYFKKKIKLDLMNLINLILAQKRAKNLINLILIF